nr:limbic system-associated membrane protein isoform X4 [Columba livia]
MCWEAVLSSGDSCWWCLCTFPLFSGCYVEDKSSKVAWLNRSGIIFAGEDKWSLDPRVELEKRNPLEYSLRIQKVDVYDEGSYTCSVQTQHHPKTSQVYLIVQVPPKISNISSDITVNEGSNVTLVCMANGRPEPVITWRHLTPTGREFEGEEEYLEILGITREQSGKYECKAANEVASADVKQVRVTVNYPPTITESKSNEAATGRQALLRCEASAVPTPDFEWYRDDTRINSANGLEIKSTGTQSLLMVANVTEEHYGNYTCVAANKLGVTNASLYLYKIQGLFMLGSTRELHKSQKNGGAGAERDLMIFSGLFLTFIFVA